MAALTDKFTRITDSNTGRPVIAKLASGKATGAATVTLTVATNWTTTTKVHIAIYLVTSAGVKDPTSQAEYEGTLVGTTISNLTLTGGTDRAYTTDAYVEITPTAKYAKDLYDGLTTSHNPDGTLLPAAVQTAIGTGTISSTNIAADAVTDAKLIYGKVRTRVGGSAVDWTLPGTTTYDYSATNTFMQVGATTLTAQTTAITFPTAFTNKPQVFPSPMGSGGLFSAGWYIVSVTTTGFSFVAADYTKATPLLWMAVGE